MATRTFTNGGVNNLWSTAGNWDTPPVDNDTVVIASGQTCEYDADWSNAGTYPNGLNGLTINGTLKISKTTSSYMKMKAATYITGAGTFNIGESGTGNNIPFATKFTLTGGAGWYITGASGLTITVYGAEPTNKYIKLSGNEAALQTELSVDTDITGDIWADGDEITICDVFGGDNEVRTIAAGGRASGAITVTAGITNAKVTGAYVVLNARNIQILGTTTPSAFISSFASGKLNIGGGLIYGGQNYLINSCTGVNFSGGVLMHRTGYSGQAYACNYFNMTGGVWVNGVNDARDIYSCSYITISGGAIIGAGDYGALSSAYSAVISGGTFACCKRVLNTGKYNSITGGLFTGNNYVFSTADVQVSGGTYSNNNVLFNSEGGAFYLYGNPTLTSVNNTWFVAVNSGKIYGVTVGTGTECGSWGNETTIQQIEFYNYGGVTGAYKAWMKGGIITSQTSVKPTGYVQAYLHAFSDATLPCYMKRTFTVPAGESVSIDVQLRKTASMTYLPRVYLMNGIENPISDATQAEDSFTMTDSTDTWESDTFSVDNSSGTTDKEYTLWFVGKNASGSMYSAYDIATAGGGGGGSVKIVPLGGIRL